MRFTIALAGLLGLTAASPCKPKPTSTSLTTTLASTSDLTTLSGVSTSASSETTSSVTVSEFPTTTSVSTSGTISSATVSEFPTTMSVNTSATTSSTLSSASTTESSISTASTSSSPTSSASITTSMPTTAPSPSSTSVSTSTAASTSSTSTQSTTAVPTITTFSTATTSSATSTIITSNPATAVVTNPVALSFYDPNLNDGTTGRDPAGSGYGCFAGPAINFPSQATWATFETMWTVLTRDEFSVNDSADQESQIRNAILTVSQRAKVDPRVILAVVMDESAGNVHVGCTTSFGGVNNCGLMQAYDSSSYDPSNSAASILQMIQDGTQGTISGPGLVQHLNDQAGTQGNLWVALRYYNSGSANQANLSDGKGATPAYVSNIANYLQGWNGYGNGPNGCDFTQPFNTSPSN